MRRTSQLLGAVGALLVTALVGGTLIGSALASPGSEARGAPPFEAQGASTGRLCDAFIDGFAAELGVERSALAPAARDAALAAIDGAVADGTLSAERAERFRARLADVEGRSICSLLVVKGHGWRASWHSDEPTGGVNDARQGIGAMIDAAAEALGMEPAEVHREMRAGVALKGIAEEAGLNYAEVRQVVLDALDEQLAGAEARGMPAERAAHIRERVVGWLERGGEWRGRSSGGQSDE
jgi:hypothetical protein